MSSDFFQEYMSNLNKVKENRKISAIIDNCPGYPNLKLSNIRVEFLPLSTTSVTQPMDQGVIKCFKTNYR
jgi:hypothetical protein